MAKDTKRPELQKMLEFVREGDIVIVESLSRFARNTRDFLELTDILQKKGVGFMSQKEHLDTNGAAGQLMLTIFAALSQFERDSILERQAEGIAIAKTEGRMTGRPKKAVEDFEEVYLDYQKGRYSATQAAKRLGIARSTWYRKVKEHLKNDSMQGEFI